MNRFLSLDIGGTFIKYGLFDKEGKEYFSHKEGTEKEPEEFFNQLLKIIEKVERIDSFKGISISIGGFINPVTGENTDFSVGKNFTTYNLKNKIKEYKGYNVAIENDANCAALAELWIGEGKGISDFIVITLGTGIGGAIISEGRLLRGKSFKAGEFGLMYLGREKKASGIEYKSPYATYTLVNKISKALGKQVDGEYIFDNLDNKTINLIYEEWLTDIALIFGNIAICFDPERILLGGGVSSQERLIDDLQRKVYEIYPHLSEYTSIKTCKLKNNAGMLGAVRNYLNEYENHKA